MIRPTEADIGRKVVYRSFRGSKSEEGEITSLAAVSMGSCVFVKFRGPTGELTPCHKLEWIAP